MPDNPVTLQDLADHLNLSRATVSLALRGAGRISPKTRERVRRAAEELGYRPDPVLSAFSRRRQKHAVAPGSVIGVIIRVIQKQGMMTHLEEPAARLGYKLEVFGWRDYPSQSALVRVLENRGVAGLLFPEQREPLTLDNALWEPFRGVYCGPYPEGGEENCPFEVVRHNPFDAMTLAWRKALEHGAHRIGLVLPVNMDELTTLDHKALAAYRYWQQQYDRQAMPRLEPLIGKFAELSPAGPLIERWIREQAPDLVIGGSFPVHHWLRNCGVRIPEDVLFIALRLRREDPTVAGVLIDIQTTAVRGLHHLHALIQHGHEMDDRGTTTLVVNATWRDGPTCPMPTSPRSR